MQGRFHSYSHWKIQKDGEVYTLLKSTWSFPCREAIVKQNYEVLLVIREYNICQGYEIYWF